MLTRPLSQEARLWTIVFAVALVPLLGWWTYGLFDLDEGFYASATADMIRRGDWITPFHNGRPFYEKPILLYWFAKPAVMLFGDWFGPRLPSVLATLATYGLVAWFVRRRLGLWPAVFSTLVLASSLLVVALGRMMMTDPLLVLFFTAAMLSFWLSLIGDARWRLVTAACLGAAVLAKGPVALLLFLPIAGYTYWRERPLRTAFRGWWLWGTLVLAAVVSLWYVPAYLAGGQTFVQEFLIEQNLGRFTGGDEAHTLQGPISLVFFLVILLVGFLPWSLALPFAWPRRRLGEVEEAPLLRYLATWFLTVLLFFTVSGAKLPHYILPLAPPLAILVGTDLARRIRLRARREEIARPFAMPLAATCALVLAIGAVAHFGFLDWYRSNAQDEAHALAQWLKQQRGPVVVYQLGRRQKALGTGQLNLQETSLPSLSFYIDQPLKAAESLEEIKVLPTWIFTRSSRIEFTDAEWAEERGLTLRRAETPVQQRAYAVYRLERSANP